MLQSGGETEARPTNPLQPSILQKNDTVDIDWLLIEQESSQSDGLDTRKDVDWLEQNETHKPDLEELLTRGKNSVGKVEIKENSFGHSRHARNPGNNCIKNRDKAIVICSKFFKIPVCKQGCQKVYKLFTFSNCKIKTKVIHTDCVRNNWMET